MDSIRAELLEVRSTIRPVDAKEIILRIRGASIIYDVAKQELVVNDLRAPAPLIDGQLTLTIYCDRTGLEIFASEGLTYIPMPFQPKPEDKSISLTADGGSAEMIDLRVFELKSAWRLQTPG